MTFNHKMNEPVHFSIMSKKHNEEKIKFLMYLLKIFHYRTFARFLYLWKYGNSELFCYFILAFFFTFNAVVSMIIKHVILMYFISVSGNRSENISLETAFTYHSFRYIEISGHQEQIPHILGFQYSMNNLNTKISQANSVIYYAMNYVSNAQQNNYLSIPTLSPSSENRIGWMLPAQVYSLTAMFMGYNNGFFRKWLRDVREAQFTSGAFSDVSPRINDKSVAGPGSGDAPIIITWNLYRMYADITALEENYDSNKRWLGYVTSANPDLIWTRNVGANYGDVFSVNAVTPKEVISTAYLAYDALLMSKMAKVLGRTSDQQTYLQLHQDVGKAFIRAFVNMTDGVIKGDTQTCYLVALAFKILPEELVPKAVQTLVDKIKAQDYHLTTGYIGK